MTHEYIVITNDGNVIWLETLKEAIEWAETHSQQFAAIAKILKTEIKISVKED